MLLAMLLTMTPGQEVAMEFAGAIVCVMLGAAIMYLVQYSKRAAIEKELQAAQNAAKSEAQKIIAQAEAQAKTEFIKSREQFDKETEQTRKELREEERRITKREDLTDRKLETLNTKERQLAAGDKALNEREKGLADKDNHLNELIEQQKTELLKVADMTIDHAREAVINRVDKEMQRETESERETGQRT